MSCKWKVGEYWCQYLQQMIIEQTCKQCPSYVPKTEVKGDWNTEEVKEP